METFITVLSFPLWFFGGIFFIGSIFNSVKIERNGIERKANLTERTVVFFISSMILFVAYLMV